MLMYLVIEVIEENENYRMRTRARKRIGNELLSLYLI